MNIKTPSDGIYLKGIVVKETIYQDPNPEPPMYLKTKNYTLNFYEDKLNPLEVYISCQQDGKNIFNFKLTQKESIDLIRELLGITELPLQMFKS